MTASDALTELEDLAVREGRELTDDEITAAAEQDESRGIVAQVREAIASRRARQDAQALEARQAADAVTHAEQRLAGLDEALAVAWDAALPALEAFVAACQEPAVRVRELLTLPPEQRVRGEGWDPSLPTHQQAIRTPSGLHGGLDTASMVEALLANAGVTPTSLQPYDRALFDPGPVPSRVVRGRAD